MEDPAITEAKRLWAEKRPSEAVRLLVARIEELNTERATSTPTAPPPLVRAKPSITPQGVLDEDARISARRKRLLGTAVLIIVVVVAYWVYREASTKAALQSAETSMQIFCMSHWDYTVGLENHCDSYAESAVKADYDDIKECLAEWDSDAPGFSNCIRERGVELPWFMR